MLRCYGLLPFVTFPPSITKPNVHAACYACYGLLRLEIPLAGGKGETLSPAFVELSSLLCPLPLFRQSQIANRKSKITLTPPSVEIANQKSKIENALGLS